VGAGLGDAAVVQHDDLVGVAHGGEAVRDGDRGAAELDRLFDRGGRAEGGVCAVVVPGVILIRKKILKRLGTCAFGWVFCRCRWLVWSQTANSRRPG